MQPHPLLLLSKISLLYEYAFFFHPFHSYIISTYVVTFSLIFLTVSHYDILFRPHPLSLQKSIGCPPPYCNSLDCWPPIGSVPTVLLAPPPCFALTAIANCLVNTLPILFLPLCVPVIASIAKNTSHSFPPDSCVVYPLFPQPPDSSFCPLSSPLVSHPIIFP